MTGFGQHQFRQRNDHWAGADCGSKAHDPTVASVVRVYPSATFAHRGTTVTRPTLRFAGPLPPAALV